MCNKKIMGINEQALVSYVSPSFFSKMWPLLEEEEEGSAAAAASSSSSSSSSAAAAAVLLQFPLLTID